MRWRQMVQVRGMEPVPPLVPHWGLHDSTFTLIASSPPEGGQRPALEVSKAHSSKLYSRGEQPHIAGVVPLLQVHSSLAHPHRW